MFDTVSPIIVGVDGTDTAIGAARWANALKLLLAVHSNVLSDAPNGTHA